MTRRTMMGLVLIIATIVAGCTQTNPPTVASRKTTADGKKDAQLALARAKQQATEAKEDYHQRMEAELRELDDRWQELSRHARRTLAETRTRAGQQIEGLKTTLLRTAGAGNTKQEVEKNLGKLASQAAELEREGSDLLVATERKRDVARQELDKVKAAPADAWKDARADMDRALEELKKALDAARDRFP